MELTARLSEAETTCVQTALGDTDYQSFLTAPVSRGVSTPYERPVIPDALLRTLFDCLVEENVHLMGALIMDAQAGGWTDETRGCVINTVDEHPEVIHVWFGVEMDAGGAEEEHIGDVHSYLLDLWQCFTDREKVDFTLYSSASFDSEVGGTTGRELLDVVLTDGETSCLAENLPQGSMSAIRDLPSLDAVFTIPGIASAQTCLESDISNRIFVNGYAKRVGGLTEESGACVLAFSAEHPEYMRMVQGVDFDPLALTDKEMAEIADLGQRLFDCLNEEELIRYQNTFADRWGGY
jgi:hypothetical protein